MDSFPSFIPKLSIIPTKLIVPHFIIPSTSLTTIIVIKSNQGRSKYSLEALEALEVQPNFVANHPLISSAHTFKNVSRNYTYTHKSTHQKAYNVLI